MDPKQGYLRRHPRIKWSMALAPLLAFGLWLFSVTGMQGDFIVNIRLETSDGNVIDVPPFAMNALEEKAIQLKDGGNEYFLVAECRRLEGLTTYFWHHIRIPKNFDECRVRTVVKGFEPNGEPYTQKCPAIQALPDYSGSMELQQEFKLTAMFATNWWLRR